MNLQDYLSGKQEKRLPSFSVLLEKEDVIIYPSIPIWEGNKKTYLYGVHLKFFSYTYVTTDGNLYTQDEDGNKKSPSVFKLNFKLE
jgi:hypothetical protein